MPGEPVPTLPGAGAPQERPAEPAEPEPGPVAEIGIEATGGEALPQRVEPEPGAGAESVVAAQAQEPDQTAGAELPGAEESLPLTPATAGTLISGRYLVIEALDTQPDQIIYRVQDLQQCRQCGFSANTVGELFCAQCGASLDRKPEASLLELRQGMAEPPDAVQDAIRLAEEGRLIFLVAGPQPEPSAQSRRQGMRLLVGQRSDTAGCANWTRTVCSSSTWRPATKRLANRCWDCSPWLMGWAVMKEKLPTGWRCK
jgi:hypothetical protein